MATKTYSLSEPARAVLSGGTIRAYLDPAQSQFHLGSGQLARPLYLEVNKALEALGGRWTRSLTAHLFPMPEAELTERLDGVIESGSFSPPERYGFFETPPPLANQVIEHAEIARGMLVLEPSAGRGALATRAAEAAGGTERVHVCELIAEHRAHLAGFFVLGTAFPILSTALGTSYDFLTLEPRRIYDRVVMNPPFDARQGHVDHVLHALRFLKPLGRLVAILPAGVLFRQDAKPRGLREVVAENGGRFLPNPDDAFRASGTMVRTVTLVLDA